MISKISYFDYEISEIVNASALNFIFLKRDFEVLESRNFRTYNNFTFPSTFKYCSEVDYSSFRICFLSLGFLNARLCSLS